MFRVVTAHNTSLGDNDAFPPREDVAFDYHVLKKRFDEVIGNMESEFGYLPSPDEALSLLSEYVTLAQRKEEPIKNQLETLAFNIVNEALCVPKETVILRTSLVNRVEPLNDIRVMPEDDETSNDGYSFEDIDEVILTNKAVMKRRLINSLVQGVSYRLMLQYLDDDQIYEWDNDLVDIYYKIIYLNDYLLFAKKEKISDKHPMLGSYVDTDLGEGEKKTEIYAQALVYPLLLQEVFRGFFELFGSYGLPDDKKKANMILHKADFLVAEAWDLRMGVGLWDIVSECTTIGEDSYLPYVFTSIVALQGVEFNKMMQNIFCHTKTAQSFILGVIEDVKHDQDYNVFKQDIQTANLKKCLINDEEKPDNDTISESRMRAWDEKYLEQLRQTAQDIYNKRDDIWAGNVVKHKIQLETGEDIGVWASSREVFEEVFPNQTDAVAFQREGWICLSVEKNYSPKEIYDIIEHEFEHALDSQLSGSENIFNQAQVNINSLASSEPGETIANDVDKSDLFDTIRNVIYRLWLNSEKNAFTQEVINDKSYLKRLSWQIDYIDKKDADKNADIWHHFQPLLANRKNYTTKMSPRDIKRHFVRQSRHKLEQYKKTIFRKKGYAKINNSNEPSDEYYVSTSNGEVVGPYTFRELLDNQNRLSFGTADPKVFQKGTRKWEYLNKILMQDPEYARNMKEIELTFNESKESRLLVEGITDVTYHYCSLPTLYNILSSGQLKLTMSAVKCDAYHKTKLFYLSTQRSKNNRLGYAKNREVRIELDGYKLKSHGYQGRPLDYWGVSSMGKQTEIGIDAYKKKYGNENDDYSDEQKRNITNSQARNTYFEFEDRIFSDKPSLSLEYVSRIDCLIKKLEPVDRDILNMAQKLGLNIAFYNSEKDFILQTNNVINDEVSRIEGEYDDIWDKYDDSQKSRTYPELITKLCALLFYYKFYNNYNSNPQVINDAISNVLNKFDLAEYTEYVTKELPYVMMWIKGDIDYLGTALRQLNTDSFTNAKKSENVMLMAQYVLNHYKVSSFVNLKKYFKNHPWKSERPLNVEIVEQIPCITINWEGEEPRIYKGDRLFWNYEFPWSDEQMFYSEIEQIIETNRWNKENGFDNNDYATIHHNSKDDTSFLKYIQHLMHNKKLTAFEGATVLSKILSEEDMVKVFGYYVKPIMIDKDKMIEFENYINWDDKKAMIPALFGDEDNYYQYMFRDKN